MGFCTKFQLKKLHLLVKMTKTRRTGPARRAKNANCTPCQRCNPQKRKKEKEKGKEIIKMKWLVLPSPFPEPQGCEHYLAWFTFISRTTGLRATGVLGECLTDSRGSASFSLVALPSPFVIIVYHILGKSQHGILHKVQMKKLHDISQNKQRAAALVSGASSRKFN